MWRENWFWRSLGQLSPVRTVAKSGFSKSSPQECGKAVWVLQWHLARGSCETVLVSQPMGAGYENFCQWEAGLSANMSPEQTVRGRRSQGMDPWVQVIHSAWSSCTRTPHNWAQLHHPMHVCSLQTGLAAFHLLLKLFLRQTFLAKIERGHSTTDGLKIKIILTYIIFQVFCALPSKLEICHTKYKYIQSFDQATYIH